MPATPGTTSTRASAGTARGLPWYSGASGSGCTAAASTATTGAAAATLAHHRQRGDGSDPVGVSSSANPAHDTQTSVKLRTEKPTRWRAPGSDPGRTSSPYFT
jgi:hypothetical protein